MLISKKTDLKVGNPQNNLNDVFPDLGFVFQRPKRWWWWACWNPCKSLRFWVPRWPFSKPQQGWGFWSTCCHSFWHFDIRCLKLLGSNVVFQEKTSQIGWGKHICWNWVHMWSSQQLWWPLWIQWIEWKAQSKHIFVAPAAWSLCPGKMWVRKPRQQRVPLRSTPRCGNSARPPVRVVFLFFVGG